MFACPTERIIKSPRISRIVFVSVFSKLEITTISPFRMVRAQLMRNILSFFVGTPFSHEDASSQFPLVSSHCLLTWVGSASQSSPIPSPSVSIWVGLAILGQLSIVSIIPSPSVSSDVVAIALSDGILSPLALIAITIYSAVSPGFNVVSL